MEYITEGWLGESEVGRCSQIDRYKKLSGQLSADIYLFFPVSIGDKFLGERRGQDLGVISERAGVFDGAG